MKSTVLAAILLAASSAASFAADAVTTTDPTPLPVASTYNWSGAYVGAAAGYVAGGRIDHHYVPESTLDYDYHYKPKGGFGGIFGGYNLQLNGGVVIGVEGDINWGDVKGSGATSSPYTSTTKLDWNGSVRGRLGYAIDRFMIYGTGGVAFSHFRFDEYSSGNPYGHGSKGLTGWTLGAGAEYAFTDNWTLRGEYRYTRYSHQQFVEDPFTDDFDAKISTHDLRVGVAYKF